MQRHGFRTLRRRRRQRTAPRTGLWTTRKHGGMPARYTCKYAGNCEHGTLVAETQRTQQGHCGTCHAGYRVVNKVCVAWEGSCQNGELVALASRTAQNHCGACNAGYLVVNKGCVARFNGGCQNGQDKPVNQRTAHHQCSTCHNHNAYNGYVLTADEKCQRHCQANDGNANCACPARWLKQTATVYIPAQGRRRRKQGAQNRVTHTCKEPTKAPTPAPTPAPIDCKIGSWTYTKKTSGTCGALAIGSKQECDAAAVSLNHNDHLFPKQQGLLHLPGLHCQHHQGHPGGQREAPRRCGQPAPQVQGLQRFRAGHLQDRAQDQDLQVQGGQACRRPEEGGQRSRPRHQQGALRPTTPLQAVLAYA